jgi:hypothetical protein
VLTLRVTCAFAIAAGSSSTPLIAAMTNLFDFMNSSRFVCAPSARLRRQ